MVSRILTSITAHRGLVIALMLLAGSSASAQTVSLAWDANTEVDLAGYVVAYGTQSGQYTSTIDVGNRTTHSISSLAGGQRYYFAVQAYNVSGFASPFSAEVNAYINPTAPAPTVMSVTPNSGPTSGGTTVTIAGGNFGIGCCEVNITQSPGSDNSDF